MTTLKPEGSFVAVNGLEQAMSLIRNILQTPALITSMSNPTLNSATVDRKRELSSLLTDFSECW